MYILILVFFIAELGFLGQKKLIFQNFLETYEGLQNSRISPNTNFFFELEIFLSMYEDIYQI